ncbi:MAG: tRNA-guanine transglycosylase [Legionellales bacterium]|nr:tRNA-guanine transglycosylase [Legionellales bacterium]
MKLTIEQTVQTLRRGCLTVYEQLSIATPALAVPLTVEPACDLTPHELAQLQVTAVVFEAQQVLARPGAQVIAQQGGLARWACLTGLTIVDCGDVAMSPVLRYRSPYDGRYLTWDEAQLAQVKQQLDAHVWVVGSQVWEPATLSLRYATVTTDWEAFVTAVEQGNDLIYCSLPHRWASDGRLVIGPNQWIDISQAQYATDQQPVSVQCPCLGCQQYSRAYLYQLHQQGLAFGKRLNLIHNLQYFIDVMQNLRNCLEQGKLPILR